MSKNYNRARATEAEVVDHLIRFVGGTAAVTKLYGSGIATTYVSAGIVDLVWNENPGAYLGLTCQLLATTQAAVKTYSVVAPGVITANANGTYTLRLNIFNAAGALTDLAALQWMYVRATFKETGV